MGLSWQGVKVALGNYFDKWTGEAKGGPGKFAHPLFILITAIGGFAAVGIMSVSVVLSEDLARVWLVVLGSHGATMVLVFGAPGSPFSQPRNILLGNTIAAIVGVGCRIWIAQPLGNVGLALPVCVTLSYLLMHLTRSLNPPAGGTAAIAVVSSPEIERIGWRLVIPAVVFGAVFILVACVFINLIPGQRYPKYWLFDREAADERLSATLGTCCVKRGAKSDAPDESGRPPKQIPSHTDPENPPAVKEPVTPTLNNSSISAMRIS
jgi:HPP family